MNITTAQFGNYRFHSSDVDYAKLQFSNAPAATANASISAVSTSTGPTSIAPVDAPPAVAKPAFDAEALATSILSFVQRRLTKEAAQGASQDQLAALLAQAQEGVTTGFKQAVSELNASGALTDAVSSGISSALQKVDSGFDDLAKQLGLTTAPTPSSTTPSATNTSPATGGTSSTTSTTSNTLNPSTVVATQTNAAPAPQTNTLSQLASAYNVKFSSKQSIDLLVKTADGDTVHIQLGVKDKLSLRGGNQNNADGQQLISANEKSSGRLNISVDGNLDAGELQALGDLLNKVGDLANSFFSGDVSGALQQATALNFASPELSSLSLDLRSSVSVRAKVATYAAVQSLGDTSTNSSTPSTTPPALRLTDLADALTSLLPKASLADNPAGLLKQLLAAQIGATDQQNNPLLDFANRLLDLLGADTSSQASASTPDKTTTPATTTLPTPSTTPTKTSA